MADPYASSVLRKEHHERLVAGIEGFARDAGIQTHWIWTPLGDTCSAEATHWVKRFRFHPEANVRGLCFVRASEDADPNRHMAAIAGALVRNFIRARVMTLGKVLDEIAANGPPEATCLLIPNFFTPKAEGGAIATWQVSALYDLLIGRGARGEQTVVYAPSLAEMGKEYGAGFTALVKNHYRIVEI